MKTIVMTDIHGDLGDLLQGLNLSRLDPEVDKLVLLGDYVDRGAFSKEVISNLISLKEIMEDRFIALLGNHDMWFIEFLEGTMFESDIENWYRYGGLNCIENYLLGTGIDPYDFQSVRGYIYGQYPSHVRFLNDLKNYYEDSKFYFAHAGVRPNLTHPSYDEPINLIWADRHDTFFKKNNLDKPLVVGHTPTYNLHKKSIPYINPLTNVIGLDGGAVFGIGLNILIYRDDTDTFDTITVDKKTGLTTAQSHSYSKFVQDSKEEI